MVKNNAISIDELKMINQYTRHNYESDELYTFSMTLCDNEVDRDFERFSVDSLEKLQKLFLGKSCIFGHERRSANQTARIYQTRLEENTLKTTKAGETLVQLMAKAYMPMNKWNEEIIELIESGILKEVSVSCSVKRSVCSICGKESCQHVNGGNYNGKLAHTVLLEPMDAYECSFVVTPTRRANMITKKKDNVDLPFYSRNVQGGVEKNLSTDNSSHEQMLRSYVKFSDDLRSAVEIFKVHRPDLPDVIATYNKAADVIDALLELKNKATIRWPLG